MITKEQFLRLLSSVKWATNSVGSILYCTTTDGDVWEIALGDYGISLSFNYRPVGIFNTVKRKKKWFKTVLVLDEEHELIKAFNAVVYKITREKHERHIEKATKSLNTICESS